MERSELGQFIPKHKSGKFSFEDLKRSISPETAYKICSLCGETKGLSEFKVLRIRKRDGFLYRRNECSDCRKLVCRRPDQKLKNHFKRKYGITYDDAVGMLNKQGGVCANYACSKPLKFFPDTRKDLAVIDHCHTTGKVRGVVCDLCNKAMGMCKDNADILIGLSNYLKMGV